MAKSKPIGVRFDLEKLELIQKEQNLLSPQAVLNFLMDNYNRTASNLPHKTFDGKINARPIQVPQKELKNDKSEQPIQTEGAINVIKVLEKPKNELLIEKIEKKSSYDPFSNPRFKNKL